MPADAIATTMIDFRHMHHRHGPGRSIYCSFPIHIRQQTMVIGMAVTDEDRIDIMRPVASIATNSLLFFRRSDFKIERHTHVKQYFGLPGTYLDTTSANLVSSAMDDYLHSL